MAVELIYEDEHIQLLHVAGRKPVALVTFGAFGLPINGTWFVGRKFCEREDIEGFGFVAKGIGMYPIASVRNALATGRLNLGKPIVTYGSSTGSSPAIDFSAMLNATGVIATAPIFSLDPAFIPEDHRFAKYYVPELHQGRRIRTENMAGNIMILYDPQEPADAYHADLITAQYRGKSMTLMPVHNIGHNTFPAPEDRALLRAIIDNVVTGGSAKLIFQAARLAKKSKHDYACVLAARLLRRRKPCMALGVLESVLRNAGGFADAGNQIRRAKLAAEAYLALGRPAEATALIEDAIKLRPGDPYLLERLASCLLADRQVGPAINAWRNAIGFAADDLRLQKRLEAALDRAMRRLGTVAAA
jgi:hypothetical protein